jgi:hypothetical protein
MGKDDLNNSIDLTLEPEVIDVPPEVGFVINKYRHCHTEWEDTLAQGGAADQCPVCGAMVTPYQWEELT